MTGGQDIHGEPCESTLQVFLAEELSRSRRDGTMAVVACECSLAALMAYATETGAVPIGAYNSRRVDIAYFDDGTKLTDIIELKSHWWVLPDRDKLVNMVNQMAAVGVALAGHAVGCATNLLPAGTRAILETAGVLISEHQLTEQVTLKTFVTHVFPAIDAA